MIIGLLDGGVEAELPDLEGRVLPGGDLLGGTNGLKDTDPRQHGTKIAALLVGQGRVTGMMGMAPGARVLSVRSNNETNGSASDAVMAKAIRRAVDQGAKVINMSLATISETGQECDFRRWSAINYALENDVVIVAGAGNNVDGKNAPMQPASCPGVLAVGALDRHEIPVRSFQRQSYVSVAAPGMEVGSLEFGPARPQGFYRKNLQGTSYSTALVSGLAALIRAKYPEMSAGEVLRRITFTAADVGPKGRDELSGFGAIRPYEALTARVPPTAPNPVYDNWQRKRHQTPTPVASPNLGDIPEPATLYTRVLQIGTGVASVAALAAVVLLVLVLRSRRLQGARARPSRDATASNQNTSGQRKFDGRI